MNQERLMKVVLGPIITEKAQIMADKRRQIAFKVLPTATKREIKGAVELLFKVKVKSVCTINQKGKVKRKGQHPTKLQDWKKAYVALEEGHDISFAGAEAS
jgi:large subunit ribosomal protein L23